MESDETCSSTLIISLLNHAITKSIYVFGCHSRRDRGRAHSDLRRAASAPEGPPAKPPVSTVTLHFPATATSPAQAVECTTVTGPTYLRTSGNKEVVGFRPVTTCSAPVDSITSSGQMYYYFLGIIPIPEGAPGVAANTGSAKLTNRKIGVACSGTDSTAWYGTATVTATYHGVPMAGDVSTPDATLPCGA